MGWGKAHTAKLRDALDVLEPPEGPWLLVLRGDHSWDEEVQVDLGRLAVQELGATGVACLARGETLEALDEASMRAAGWVRAPESFVPWTLCDREHHTGVACPGERCAWNV